MCHGYAQQTLDGMKHRQARPPLPETETTHHLIVVLHMLPVQRAEGCGVKNMIVGHEDPEDVDAEQLLHHLSHSQEIVIFWYTQITNQR